MELLHAVGKKHRIAQISSPVFRRRRFLAGLSGLLAGSATWLPRPLTGAPQERPNFVFFLIDDLGWTDVACYGSRFYDTPAVDRLAKMGMRFTDGYAACTVCSPTRAAIMTRKYPAPHR